MFTRVQEMWRPIVVGLLMLMAAAPALSGTSEAYRKAWSDPAVVKRIGEGIERYRKGNVTIEVLAEDGRPVPQAALDIRQKTHAFLFGCDAFVLGQLGTPEKNARYEEMFTKLFNSATVPFYWAGTEPNQGELHYGEGLADIWRRPPPDRFVPFAKKYGLVLKGHPLLWHGHNPAWLPKSPDELKKLYQKRFQEIADRYAKDITIWDVVNESQECPKRYPLYSLDKEYVSWAFNEAHHSFQPFDLLMINDITEFNRRVGAENPYYRQIKQLLSQGVRIEGIGLQFHLCEKDFMMKPHVEGKAYMPTQLLDVYDSFGEFALPLYITEITIPTNIDDGEAVQAEVIGNLYRLWFSAPQMAGITYWDLVDGTAFDWNRFNGGLIDKEMHPKESYRVLDRLINHDWRTRIVATTDAQGKAGFRGYYGKYTITVAADNVVKDFEIDLTKDGQPVHKLILRP